MRSLGPWLIAAVVLGATARPAVGESFRVLTYNLWHGFWRTAEKEVVLLPSEPSTDRSRRYETQLVELTRLEPDVLLAQEVHPLPWRAGDLARALEHDSEHQLVSCGVRLLNIGIPWLIRSGLVMTSTRRSICFSKSSR